MLISEIVYSTRETHLGAGGEGFVKTMLDMLHF